MPQFLLENNRKQRRVFSKFPAVRETRMNYEESGNLLRFHEEGLQGYTYLES
jgi:hypothetical protein